MWLCLWCFDGLHSYPLLLFLLFLPFLPNLPTYPPSLLFLPFLPTLPFLPLCSSYPPSSSYPPCSLYLPCHPQHNKTSSNYFKVYYTNLHRMNCSLQVWLWTLREMLTRYLTPAPWLSRAATWRLNTLYSRIYFPPVSTHHILSSYVMSCHVMSYSIPFYLPAWRRPNPFYHVLS